jgi:hypothetical protein
MPGFPSGCRRPSPPHRRIECASQESELAGQQGKRILNCRCFPQTFCDVFGTWFLVLEKVPVALGFARKCACRCHQGVDFFDCNRRFGEAEQAEQLFEFVRVACHRLGCHILRRSHRACSPRKWHVGKDCQSLHVRSVVDKSVTSRDRSSGTIGPAGCTIVGSRGASQPAQVWWPRAFFERWVEASSIEAAYWRALEAVNEVGAYHATRSEGVFPQASDPSNSAI